MLSSRYFLVDKNLLLAESMPEAMTMWILFKQILVLLYIMVKYSAFYFNETCFLSFIGVPLSKMILLNLKLLLVQRKLMTKFWGVTGGGTPQVVTQLLRSELTPKQ